MHIGAALHVCWLFCLGTLGAFNLPRYDDLNSKQAGAVV